MKTLPVARFLGINNRLPDTALRIATSQLNGQYLKSADNVEVDNAGKLVRRRGTALVVALTGAHSLHGELLVRDSALYRITLPNYTETLLKILASNATMSYVTVGADTYYSNGTDSGRVTGATAYPLGLMTPDAPALVTVSGALLSGGYQVGVSYANSVTGEEGGVSVSSNTELVATGGVRVTLPPAAPGATHINVYLSGANGSIPLLLASVPVGTATYDCVALATGRESNGRFEAPLPAGTLFTSNGRLCSFSGNTVYVGLPFRPGYYLPAEGYIPFAWPVSLAVENQGGTYIAADKTYWVPGDLGDVTERLVTVLPYGAVPGTAWTSPNRSDCGWFGAKGLVVGAQTGEVQAVMESNVDVTPPVSGLAFVSESGGHRRVMTCGWCVNLENGAATTYSDWDFTSVSGTYGTKPDGIYALNETATVPWSFGLGRVDFGSEELKHLPNVYAGVACETELELTVAYVDERGFDQSYTYPTRGSCELMKQQRFDTGKGLRASWFDLTVSNITGSDFTLASMSFAPTQSTRRI